MRSDTASRVTTLLISKKAGVAELASEMGHTNANLVFHANW
jgi:hypothetical protein